MLKRLVLVASVFATLLGTAAAGATTWNMHVAWPPANYHTQGAERFATLVKERTAGRVTIKVHPGGALGFKGEEILRVTRTGALPMAEVLMGNVEGEEPVFGLPTLPLVADSYAEARALYDANRAVYEKALQRHGLVLLYASAWPPSGIFTKKPLATAADLKGIKIRTYDAMSAKFVETLGGRGLPIPFAELYTALATGLVDGVLTSTITGVDAKLWEVTKHFTPVRFAYPLNMVVLSEKSLARLSDADRKELLAAAAVVQEEQWAAAEKADAEAAKTLRANGITFADAMPEALAKDVRATAETLRKDWLDRVGKPAGVVVDPAAASAH